MVAGKHAELKQCPLHGRLTGFVQRLDSKTTDRRLGFLISGGPNAMQSEQMEATTTLLGAREWE